MLIATACAGLYLANLLVFCSFHILDRSNDVLHHAVSDYALGGTAWLFKLYGVIGTAAALLLAGLFHAASPAPFHADTPVYLIVMAAARVGLTVYPTDGANAAATRVGRIHFLSAALSFTSATVLVLRTGGTFAAHPQWPALQSLWLLLEAIVVSSFVALVVARLRSSQRYFGLLERVFILANALWLLLAASWFVAAQVRVTG